MYKLCKPLPKHLKSNPFSVSQWTINHPNSTYTGSDLTDPNLEDTTKQDIAYTTIHKDTQVNIVRSWTDGSNVLLLLQHSPIIYQFLLFQVIKSSPIPLLVESAYFDDGGKALSKYNLRLLSFGSLGPSLGVKDNNKLKPTYVSQEKLCPVCNAPLVLRDGKFGKFYGCSKYPNCKAVVNLDGLPSKGTKLMIKGAQQKILQEQKAATLQEKPTNKMKDRIKDIDIE